MSSSIVVTSILLNAVQEAEVPIYPNSKVTATDPSFSAGVQLVSGEWISGDVIICADGIKSDIRRQMTSAHGVTDHSHPTGDAAYRVLVPKDKIAGDEKALELLKENVGMQWMGPGDIMAYPIKNNTAYNMVLLHPAKPSQHTEKSWTNKGDKKEMMAFCKDLNPMFKDLLYYVPEGEVMEWTLNSHRPLPSRIENKCVLIGDVPLRW